MARDELLLMVVHSDGLTDDPEAEPATARRVGDRLEVRLADGQILDFDRSELHEATAPGDEIQRAA